MIAVGSPTGCNGHVRVKGKVMVDVSHRKTGQVLILNSEANDDDPKRGAACVFN